MTNINSQFEELDSIGESINNILYELYEELVKLLFSKSKITLRSKRAVKRSKKITTNNIKDIIKTQVYNARDIRIMKDIIYKINSIEALDHKIDMLSTINTPLMSNIKEILENTVWNNHEKQVLIEKILIEYELDYFNKNIDTPNARSKLLHKIYPQFKKAFQGLINKYSINRYLKLFKAVELLKENKSNFNNNYYKTIGILVILYMGEKNTISYTFSQLVQFLNINSEQVKRTNLAILLGTKFVKLLKHLKLKHNPDLDKIIPLNELKTLINNLNDKGLFFLGDTLLHLITDNCDIFEEDVINRGVKDSYTIMKMNEEFISDLTLGSINLLQLPMIVEPRKIEDEGLYYPYINAESTNLHLFEGNLIKSKYNQKYKTESSDILHTSINYLNSIKFKINKKMLNFVLEEWNNKDSKLFKGFNVYQNILNTDSKNIKINKLSNNSKYQLYINIINIAYLYKDQEFYLPVFVDFRGRVYPLSNYISYQGGDLARSLISFYISSSSTVQISEQISEGISDRDHDLKEDQDSNKIDEGVINNVKFYLANTYKFSKSINKEKLS